MIKSNGSGRYKSSILIGKDEFYINCKTITEAHEKERVLCNLRNNVKHHILTVFGTKDKELHRITGRKATVFVEEGVKQLIDIDDDKSLDRYETSCLKALGNPEGLVKKVFTRAIHNKIFFLISKIESLDAALNSRFADTRNAFARNHSVTEKDLEEAKAFNQKYFSTHQRVSGF